MKKKIVIKLVSSFLMFVPMLVMASGSQNGLLNNQNESYSAAGSNASNAGNSQDITFNSPQPHKNTSVDTTPSVYTAPSAFGFSNQNCGASSTLSVGVTGIGVGASFAGSLDGCNTRNDVIILEKMGMTGVATLRMVCYGTPINRDAYTAIGGVCPKDAYPVVYSNR